MPHGQTPSPAESPGKSFQPITMSCKIVSGEAPWEESLCAIQSQIPIIPLKTVPVSVPLCNDLMGTMQCIRTQLAAVGSSNSVLVASRY